MSKKRKPKARAEPMPAQTRSTVWLTDSIGYETLACSGYVSLNQNPEIVTAIDTIARLIGSMTIHLMQNTDKGDIRVVNELSRKVDIEPNNYMTRSNLIYWIVRTMLLEGDGNAVLLPRTENGLLKDLLPLPPSSVSFIPDGIFGYKIFALGKEYAPEELLHFVTNPGTFYPWKGEGYRIALKDVANNLKQAAATTKGFMSSKWKPSVIVKVDALTDEFASPAGRKKLLAEYLDTSEAGEPWMIPAEQFSVEQVRPLTLADLAISDCVQLDKKTIAAVLGIPSFVLKVGDFNREEWNSFISTRIMPLARNIEQVLTKRLLYSPNLYFRFNSRSLYNYDLKDLAAIADDQYVRGIMTGNEVRDWIGLSPKEGLDELVILENYIPRGMIGQQSKLNGGENE